MAKEVKRQDGNAVEWTMSPTALHVTSLTAGSVVCAGSNPFELEIKGGFVEVAHNWVSLCVEE